MMKCEEVGCKETAEEAVIFLYRPPPEALEPGEDKIEEWRKNYCVKHAIATMNSEFYSFKFTI